MWLDEAPLTASCRFLDGRRVVFYWEDKKYISTLVDLPNLIESQSTYDNKQFHKIADISQVCVCTMC
jgi:TATA-binding protein-associated factor Taf7